MRERGIAALVNEDRLRRILTRMLDENEFLSPYGIRALSRYHADHPFMVNVEGQEYRVNYLPAESDTGMFGGNSNWRGPIWMPVNAILIRALMSYYLYYGDNFKIECPTGSGNLMNLFEVAHEIANLAPSSPINPRIADLRPFLTCSEMRVHRLSHGRAWPSRSPGSRLHFCPPCAEAAPSNPS